MVGVVENERFVEQVCDGIQDEGAEVENSDRLSVLGRTAPIDGHEGSDKVVLLHVRVRASDDGSIGGDGAEGRRVFTRRSLHDWNLRERTPLPRYLLSSIRLLDWSSLRRNLPLLICRPQLNGLGLLV